MTIFPGWPCLCICGCLHRHYNVELHLCDECLDGARQNELRHGEKGEERGSGATG